MNPLLALVSSRHLTTAIACLGASVGLAVTTVFLQDSAAAERVRVVSAKVAPRGKLAQQLVESADATPGQASHENLLFRHGTYPAAVKPKRTPDDSTKCSVTRPSGERWISKHVHGEDAS